MASFAAIGRAYGGSLVGNVDDLTRALNRKLAEHLGEPLQWLAFVVQTKAALDFGIGLFEKNEALSPAPNIPTDMFGRHLNAWAQAMARSAAARAEAILLSEWSREHLAWRDARNAALVGVLPAAPVAGAEIEMPPVWARDP